MGTVMQAEEQIRHVLRDYGRLTQDVSQLATSADLYQLGLTPDAAGNVMLALEATFEIEFPDDSLQANVFRNIESITRVVGELTSSH